MARYTGADCKRCRREKVKLFLKGAKCDGPKCPIESRPYPPGQHGRGRSKESEYLLQMREKQNCAHFQQRTTQSVKKLAQLHFQPETSLMQLAQAQVKELLVL